MSIYGLDHAKQNRSMIRTEQCYDWAPHQLPGQCQLMITHQCMIHMHCTTTVPKINAPNRNYFRESTPKTASTWIRYLLPSFSHRMTNGPTGTSVLSYRSISSGAR